VLHNERQGDNFVNTCRHTLTLFDRCYFSAAFFLEWQQVAMQTHWLTPVKSKLYYYQVIERYSDYDMLIEQSVSPQTRKAALYLPAVWRTRMVSYV
jgi:hypothetical protein